MSTNLAAYLPEVGKPFAVDKADFPEPGPGEVVIQTKALAINPVDWKIQDNGYFVKHFPCVLGSDIAGDIIAVGDGVTNFKSGDRVIGANNYLLTGADRNAGYQHYVALPASLVSKIPSNLDYAQASVLPLAISTAAMGLYAPDHLKLPLPSSSPTPNPAGNGQTILIWGAASSVGSAAVQLARASGLRVVATASARNEAFVRGLGADVVVDYSAADAVEQCVDAISPAEGKGEFVGVFDAIAEAPSVAPWAEIVKRVGRKVPVSAALDPSSYLPEGYVEKFPKPTMCMAFLIQNQKELCQAIWGEFVPQALANGVLRAEPKAVVAGSGLESVQEANVKQKAGVSAAKIVVTL